MWMPDHIPMVRCRLDGGEDGRMATLRYIPLAEFDLWQHLMETRHHRHVTVEEVSLWVSEEAAWWDEGVLADELQPVLRVQFERPGPNGVPVPVERFFPAETYPQAREALLSHFIEVSRLEGLASTPGYFVPKSRQPSAVPRIA
jgi:hypothetical protein